jgi:hypothetical protein
MRGNKIYKDKYKNAGSPPPRGWHIVILRIIVLLCFVGLFGANNKDSSYEGEDESVSGGTVFCHPELDSGSFSSQMQISDSFYLPDFFWPRAVFIHQKGSLQIAFLVTNMAWDFIFWQEYKNMYCV